MKALTSRVNTSLASELREHPRYTMQHAKGVIKKTGLFSSYTEVRVIDISKGGIGVACRKSLMIGERVEVKLGNKKYLGIVVFGSQILGSRELRVGIQFENKLGISDMLFFGAPMQVALE
ncbi:PilZ domain-containing protein [Vibrio sp. ZSDZ65]|uniref:PilZ domain-containing protein n=1 Tax=Vibrio qingdaonensis TaxID=2829491 RepID=A0A9X3CT72_9VIBR|nr:PilZ domain-containing protein [Vibrio qingdaonensis]MCW8349030.1 PilZ domain-containing protein [Vibrio qingdaonensis]